MSNPALIQIRRGTAAAWTAANPVLLAGEQGFETDTYKGKTGDGATVWTSLAYDRGRYTAAGLAMAQAASAAAQALLLGLGTTDKPTFANVQITPSTLTYGASTAVDFSLEGLRTCSLTGNITFTTSNLAAGRKVVLRIVADGSTRTFTFPAGWTFVGGAAPANIAASKTALLTLASFSTTDANVVAQYSVQS